MKLTRSVFALLLATAVVPACDKASDVPAMQQEATGLAKLYAGRFAHLEQQRQMLEERAKPVAGMQVEGAPTANAAYQSAVQQLAKLRADVAQAPAVIANTKDRAAAIALLGDMRKRFEDGYTLVNTQFDQYAQFLANAAASKNAVAQAGAAQGGGSASDPANTPSTPGQPQPNEAGSNSPPTPSGTMPPSSSTQGGPDQRAPAGGH